MFHKPVLCKSVSCVSSLMVKEDNSSGGTIEPCTVIGFAFVGISEPCTAAELGGLFANFSNNDMVTRRRSRLPVFRKKAAPPIVTMEEVTTLLSISVTAVTTTTLGKSSGLRYRTLLQ